MYDAAPPSPDDPLAFLRGGGECGRLIARKDWSNTALGPIEGWSPALKTATALLLASPVPIVMLWGPEGKMIYNDAYSVFAGKRHPHLLGSKVLEGWPEVADFNAHVMEAGLAGRTLAYRNLELTLHRHGWPEQVWMNLDYSPVLELDGHPAGVLAIVVETTEQVLAERALRQRQELLTFFDRLTSSNRELAGPAEIMAVTTKLLGEKVDATICAYADVDPDADGFTIRGEWLAPGATSLVGSYRLSDFGPRVFDELSAGRSLITQDNSRDLGDEGGSLIAKGLWATVCIPLIRQGRLTAMMAVHSATPRDWTKDELSLIEETVERSWAYIERVRTELALQDSEARYRSLFESIDEGFCIVEFVDGDHGPNSDYVHVEANEAYAANAGIPNVVGQYLRQMVPEEADRWIARYRPVLETGQPVRFEQELVATGRHLELAAFRVDPPSRRQVAVLFKDISDRKRADTRQQLLLDELSHRAKNLLTIVQSLAVQTFNGSGSADAMRATFEGRLGALAAAHGTLTRKKWEAVPIGQIIHDTFEAVYSELDRVTLDGPDLMLAPKTGVSLAMAIHELATNALKYGSLSVPGGSVSVTWRSDDDRLHLEWRESGGPPVDMPATRGFGSRMIERGLAAELDGTVRIDFDRDGLVCTVDAPLPRPSAA